MRSLLSDESLLVGHPDQTSEDICEAGENMGVKRVPIIISERCSVAWKFIMENKEFGITLVQLYACNLQKQRNVRDLHYCSVIYNDCKWLTECLDHLTSKVNYDKSELIKVPAICALLNAQMERIWEEKTNEMKVFHEKLVCEKCSSLDEIDYQEVENEIRHCFSKFVVRMDEDKSLMCRYIEKSTVTSILSKVTLHVMEQLECAILLLQKIEPSHITPLVSVIQRLSSLDSFEQSKLASIKLMLDSSLEDISGLWQQKKLNLSEQDLRKLAHSLHAAEGKAKVATLFH